MEPRSACTDSIVSLRVSERRRSRSLAGGTFLPSSDPSSEMGVRAPERLDMPETRPPMLDFGVFELDLPRVIKASSRRQQEVWWCVRA